MITACMGKKIFRWKAAGEGRRDIFRVFQIQGPHSALDAGFKKKKLKLVVRRVASALILMRQEGERGIEIAWVTGRRGDRVLFFRLGRGLDEVSFVSYFKRNCLISSRQHLSRRWMRRRGEGYSHFRLRKRRISAARFIKEQSLQRGHKLSSEVFTIITITSHPSPPHSLFLFCCRLIPPLFTSEPVILRPFLSCLFSLLADLSSFTAAPHCCDIGQIFFYHLC